MKRILSLLLAALMLLSVTACGEITDDASETTAANTSATSEVDTENPDFVCDLPDDLDYGDAVVNILYADVTGRNDELVGESDGGVVSQAVFERNVTVEDFLGIKLELYPSKSTAADHKNDVAGGTGAYDIIANGTNTSVIPSMQGNYLNLSVLENIDTSKHYWTQGYNEMATFTDADMQFLASGPIAISMFRYMFLTLYNRTLFTDYKIPDLYETVKNGDWTLDYQYSILKDHYVDKDGDSKHSDGDFYGFVTGDTISVDPYMVASNIHMIIRDADTGDLMYNTAALNPLVELCDKVQLIYNDDSTHVYRTATKDDVPNNYIIDHFTAGNAMMVTTLFLKMELNFDMLAGMSYGIAPMPKYSKEQESYHSYVQDQVSCFGISAVVGDEDRQEMLAATLEALAYQSYLLVRPAYYEVCLSKRYMQDPQSNEVLDMIFDTLDFDFSSSCSNIFTSCVIRDNLRPLLSGSKNTIISSTKSWKNAINRALRSHNEKLEELKP